MPLSQNLYHRLAFRWLKIWNDTAIPDGMQVVKMALNGVNPSISVSPGGSATRARETLGR